jgi:LPXTG-motif cell wall-anchored protein
MPASFIKAPARCQSLPKVNLERCEKLVGIAQSGILPLMQDTVRIVAGVLAVLLVAIIFLRRKKKKDTADDEF